MVSVHDDFVRKGYAKLLFWSTLKLAKQKGYQFALCECTVEPTQKIVEALGFEKKNVVTYDDFEYEGNYPFKGLKGET